MQLVSMKYIKDRMELFYYAKEPIMLLGLPGVGKTEILTQKSKEILTKYNGDDNGFFIIDLSGLPEESLVVPAINPYANVEKNEDRFIRELLPELKRVKEFTEKYPERTAIIFIDEITSAIQGDQRTLMNFVNSGLLPDGTQINKEQLFVVLAGNPDQSIPGYEDFNVAVNPIEEAVFTRVATFFVEAKVDDFISWGKEFNSNGRQNIHPYLISALEKDRTVYQKYFDDEVRVCNSRTLKKLSNIFYSASDLGKQWEQSDVKAYLGDSIGSQISEIISKLDRLVSVEELFGPDKTKTLNKTALSKFQVLDDFEKYYIISTALDNSSPISFSKKNNMIKLKELLGGENIPPETLLALIPLLQNAIKANPKSNAAQVFASEWGLDEETNILDDLIAVKNLQQSIV